MQGSFAFRRCCRPCRDRRISPDARAEAPSAWPESKISPAIRKLVSRITLKSKSGRRNHWKQGGIDGTAGLAWAGDLDPPGRPSFDNFWNEKQAIGLGGGVTKGFIQRQRGSNFIRPGDIDQ